MSKPTWSPPSPPAPEGPVTVLNHTPHARVVDFGVIGDESTGPRERVDIPAAAHCLPGAAPKPGRVEVTAQQWERIKSHPTACHLVRSGGLTRLEA